MSGVKHYIAKGNKIPFYYSCTYVHKDFFEVLEARHFVEFKKISTTRIPVKMSFTNLKDKRKHILRS
jgi:hypothetical protein